MPRKLFYLSFILFFTVLLTGCGGGGSSNGNDDSEYDSEADMELDEEIYQPGQTAPRTTAPASKTVESEGQSVHVSLDDGTRAEIPDLKGPYEVNLDRTDTGEDFAKDFQEMTNFSLTGSTRSLTVRGTNDSADFSPVVTFPVQEAGSVNLETVNVLRVGNAVVDGQLVEDHLSVFPVSVDEGGDLVFVDHMLSDALEGPENSHVQSSMARSLEDEVNDSWQAHSSYVLMTFQDDMNWKRAPRLVRMIPDPENDEGGFRRPATEEEIAEMAERPLCNVVLLVHGHNEEEKEGIYEASEESPWFFSYKRRVWDLLFEQVAQEEETDEGSQPVYPYECTAFYEFVYPTYRPIFSNVLDRSGDNHETLGQALGVMIQQEFVNNSQLRDMVQNDMAFNATIVAHSQGGLVARSGLRDMPREFKSQTDALITWGTPHRGAALYTLRYALQSGHDLIINDRKLPLQEINNCWFWGPRYRDALNTRLALDTPGIRDLRWDISQKDKVDLYSLFPSLEAEDSEEQLDIPLFSENLAVFNTNTAREEISGEYHYFFGETSKRTQLVMQPFGGDWWSIQDATAIGAGALLNEYMMHEQYEPNDGAVPVFSQQARGVAGNTSNFVNMGNTDHEEFYGADPEQRSPETIQKGRHTARTSFDVADLDQPRRSCPTLEAEVELQDDLIVISGQLNFDLYAPEHGGDGQLGRRIERIEARAGTQEGQVINDLSFDHEDDGWFEGQGQSEDVSEENIFVVAVLKDGSEVAEEADQTSVSILPPRIKTYRLQAGGTEVEDTFKAAARPDGVYTFKWDFGDGSPTVADEKQPGERSEVSHIFEDLQDGDKFFPEVKLYDQDDKLIAEDSIYIEVRDEEEGEQIDIPINYDCGWDPDYSKPGIEVQDSGKTFITFIDEYTGERYGLYVEWHDDSRNQVFRAGCYSGRPEGEMGFSDRHGTWTWWYEDGHKQQVKNFNEGVREGEYRAWYDPSRTVERPVSLVMKGQYVNGERDGTWEYFHRWGEIRQRRTYDDGEVVSVVDY